MNELLLESFVKCTMCKTNYTKPKFLHCLHTFCCDCIKGEGEQNYPCPTCSSITVLPKAGPSQLLTNELSDILAKISAIKDSTKSHTLKSPNKNVENESGPPNDAPPLPPPLCQDCLLDEPDIATQYCTQCSMAMCKLDAKAHLRHFNSHKLIATEEVTDMDLKSLLSLSSTPVCSFHARERATSYCNSCQTVLCEACVPPHQRCESMRNINEALGEAQNTLSTFQEKAVVKSKQLEKILQDLPIKRETIENVRNAKKFHIESMLNELILVLEKRKQTLVTRIDSFYEGELEQLSNVEGELKLNLTSLENLGKTCQVYSNSQLSSSMTSLLPYLEGRLEQITRFASKNEMEIEEKSELEAIVDSHTSYLLEHIGRIVLKKNPHPEVTINAESLGINKFKPSSMAVSKENNNIFVYDGYNRSVRRLGARGDLVKTFNIRRGGEEVLVIHGMAVSNSFIYLLVQNKNTIRVFSPSGQHFQDLGEDGSKDRQFNFGGFGGLATSKGGHLFVADYNNHRVHLFSDDLCFRQMIGADSEKVGSLKFPIDVAVCNEDRIIVLHRGNPCINIYDMKGNFLSTFASFTEDQELFSPLKISIAHTGEIILNNTDSIAVFSKDKVCLTKIVLNGKDLGNFNQPSDIVTRNDRILMVCDKFNSLIQVYQLNALV